MQTLRHIWERILSFFRRSTIPEFPPHEHEWVSKAITYAAPRREAFQVTQNPELLEKIILGVTSIVWECSVCHDFKQERMLGSDRIQLDEILDKADLYGAQYIERGGNSFVIEKRVLPPIQASPLGLPIR